MFCGSGSQGPPRAFYARVVIHLLSDYHNAASRVGFGCSILEVYVRRFENIIHNCVTIVLCSNRLHGARVRFGFFSGIMPPRTLPWKSEDPLRETFVCLADAFVDLWQDVFLGKMIITYESLDLKTGIDNEKLTELERPLLRPGLQIDQRGAYFAQSDCIAAVKLKSED